MKWYVLALYCFVIAGGLLRPQPRTIAAPLAPGDDWKYDVVYRKRGVPFRGLVVEQARDHVLIQCVLRKPGSPTVIFAEHLPRQEIARIELLPDEERAQLRHRLDALRRERKLLTEQLKALDPAGQRATSADTLRLRAVPWIADPKVKALRYSSSYFQLVSNARPEIVRLAAVHLEHIYAAYARLLPPRTTGAKPTTIILTRSLTDYQALMRQQGHNLFNPAFYNPARNQVVCGSDLETLGEEVERARRYHQKLNAELNERQAELRRVYNGQVPAGMMAPIQEARRKIQTTEQRNTAAFQETRRRLFHRLYHESFHAYLANFVYPGRDAVPRWLNEGLAQIFETAILEAGEMRIGHADAERLHAVRLALAKGTLLPLTDLLRSGPKQFLIAHTTDKQVADRYYLASWALAFYLTFERHLLGTPALDQYVQRLQRGDNPLEAFSELVGQPLPRFEKDFQEYLQHLRPSGRTTEED